MPSEYMEHNASYSSDRMGKNVCNGDDMSFTDLMEGQFKVSWSGDGVSAAAVLERGKPLQS